jgi:hypothetical protein
VHRTRRVDFERSREQVYSARESGFRDEEMLEMQGAAGLHLACCSVYLFFLRYRGLIPALGSLGTVRSLRNMIRMDSGSFWNVFLAYLLVCVLAPSTLELCGSGWLRSCVLI